MSTSGICEGLFVFPGTHDDVGGEPPAGGRKLMSPMLGFGFSERRTVMSQNPADRWNWFGTRTLYWYSSE